MEKTNIMLGILHSEGDSIEFVHEQGFELCTERIYIQRGDIRELLVEITREELLVGLGKGKLREIGERYERFRRG